jgi:glycosyltransferase involved in cell wall biosynthesis
MTRKQILIVSMQPPRMPGMGGEVRTFHFVDMATELGDVTLVSFGGPNGNVPAQAELVRKCVQVIEPVGTERQEIETTKNSTRTKALLRTLSVLAIPWQNRWTSFLTYWIQFCTPDNLRKANWSKHLLTMWLQLELKVFSQFARIPPLATFMYNDSFSRVEPQIKLSLATRKFDVLWIENSLTFPYAKEILRLMRGPRPLILCNAQNIESLVQLRIAEHASSLEAKQFGRQQADLTRQLEIEAYRMSDLVIQCSEEDTALGRGMVKETEFISIANGVCTDYFSKSPDGKPHEHPTILFTAGFGYRPNRDGLRFFLRDVYPRIQKSVPNCRFVFAGAGASEMIGELEIADPSVVCTCSPSDIRPCFEQAWVYVVPLLAGGGTRLKILEAMSMERAVVSTRLGAEGIPYVEGEHLMLADDPGAFADQVIRLLGDKLARRKLESAAKRWVDQNYDWRVICGKAKERLSFFVERQVE